MNNPTHAKYTAVVSDLHLCEGEPEKNRNPLWKKFKTREFFFDEAFRDFLNYLNSEVTPDTVELILNGDIFDFDSFTFPAENVLFNVSWLERRRGLYPQEEKLIFQIDKILFDHSIWIEALAQFVNQGHRVIFIIGNHDLGLHFTGVQARIIERMNLSESARTRVQFNEWFYVSNFDTLIEHGNQHDPYCVCQDPVNPFIRRYNKVELRLPLGNLACRYMTNGIGFVNPHVDSNYIMTVPQYVRFYFKYLLRTQPLIIWTWIWGASITMYQSVRDRLRPTINDPFTMEEKIVEIARKSNSTPRIVRELRELFAPPAESDPLLVARELWLDRAGMVLVAFYLIYIGFNFVHERFGVSYLWIFIPMIVFFPFLIFYSKTMTSEVHKFMEPKERILMATSLIAGVNRIIYGHSHIVRHEIIGAVEHLNSGCWSPAFVDVECTQPIDQKTFVWVAPGADGKRVATLKTFVNSEVVEETFQRRRKENESVSSPEKDVAHNEWAV